MKRFILLAGLVLFVFLTYPPALLAQGTANCKVSGSGTSRKCDTVNNCDPDYEPPSGICIDLTNCDTAPVSCVPTQPPVPAPQELALLPDHFRFAKILTLTHPDAYRQGLVLVAAAHLFNSVVLSLGIPPLPALLRRIVIR